MSQYLLVLNDLDQSPELIAAANELAGSDPAADFVLVVPATMLTGFDALLLPYSTSTQRARARAQRMRAEILAAGLQLSAVRLGNSSPLRAIDDALRFANYAAVVIATPAHQLLHLVHRDLACRAAARYPRVMVIHAGGGKRPSPSTTMLGSASSPGGF